MSTASLEPPIECTVTAIPQGLPILSRIPSRRNAPDIECAVTANTGCQFTTEPRASAFRVAVAPKETYRCPNGEVPVLVTWVRIRKRSSKP